MYRGVIKKLEDGKALIEPISHPIGLQQYLLNKLSFIAKGYIPPMTNVPLQTANIQSNGGVCCSIHFRHFEMLFGSKINIYKLMIITCRPCKFPLPKTLVM